MSVHAVHSAARRYCMERLDALLDNHRYSIPRDMSPEQLDAWQADIALRGILPSIERVLPGQFTSVASLRAHLLDVCSHARWLVGDVRDDADGEPEPRRAERERFRMYVAQLSEVDVEHLARVPARHVLEAAERRSRLQRVARAWPSGEERWHPHAAVLESPGVVAVQSAWVGTDELPLAPMRRAPAAVAGTSIWELHEGAPWWTDDVRAYSSAVPGSPERIGPLWLAGYVLDPALWWTPTMGPETLWASPSLDWLLYMHHEGVLYVAGAGLAPRVEEIWPNWERRIWTTYAYDYPIPYPFGRRC